MDDRQIQTSSIKNDLEFVGHAADILTKLFVQMDKCCPDCRELIKDILKV